MQQLHQEIVLSLNADSTEFCPVEGLQHLLAVGTYELDESSQTRNGLLYLYELVSSSLQDSNSSSSSWDLQQLQTQPVPGIFDMKWYCYAPAHAIAACADGNLHLFKDNNNADSHSLQRVQQAEVATDAMALSVDVSASGDKVVTSSSAGMLCTVQVCCLAEHNQINRRVKHVVYCIETTAAWYVMSTW